LRNILNKALPLAFDADDPPSGAGRRHLIASRRATGDGPEQNPTINHFRMSSGEAARRHRSPGMRNERQTLYAIPLPRPGGWHPGRCRAADLLRPARSSADIDPNNQSLGSRGPKHRTPPHSERPAMIGRRSDARWKAPTGRSPRLVREIIAKRIIVAAKKGERDPVRLRNAGLAALGYDRQAI
jgi:hypothetical protein